MNDKIRKGDFSKLAEEYSLHRPDYSKTVCKAIIGTQNKSTKNIEFLDIGAGTGIWTRMVIDCGIKSAIAIEPNKNMIENGMITSKGYNISWRLGSAEDTGLENNSFDWISMASSFHWADFKKSTKEFHRLLRPGGRFTAIWNPRLIEVNPLLVEIEVSCSIHDTAAEETPVHAQC